MANRTMQAKMLKIRKFRQKHRKYSYNPHSPIALSTRNGNSIDLASTVPDTWEFGRRGLVMSRAVGPTAVAKHVDNGLHRPTVIPRMVAKVEYFALVQYEETPAGKKFRDFLHQKVFERPEYTIFMWFSGNEFIFEKRLNEPRVSYRSLVYDREQAKRRQKQLHLICWVNSPISYPSG